jgi:hypothetical protein
LLEEVKRLARLRHPNIVAVYDAGVQLHTSSASLPYIAMELLDAGTLEDSFADIRVSQTLRQNLQAFCELLEALLYAHDLGVYHSDLTPRNLIVTRYGDRYQVKVADFGFPSFEKVAPVERASEDAKRMRSLFWDYFFFPAIPNVIDEDEFRRLDLRGMYSRISDLCSFRLFEQVLQHDEGFVGASETPERERRLTNIALAYVLDHPMKNNVIVRVQPWLGADVAVERSEDNCTFLLWPAVTTEGSGYMFLLLSLSDVYHHDYGLCPRDLFSIDAPDTAKSICEDFLHNWRFIYYFSDMEYRAYLLPTVMNALPAVLERDLFRLKFDQASSGIFKLCIYKALLLKYGLKGCSDPLELDNYDSSSRISPRKGEHYVKASNVYTRIQGPGSTRGADRRQGQSRDLSRAPTEATGFLSLAGGIPGTSI